MSNNRETMRDFKVGDVIVSDNHDPKKRYKIIKFSKRLDDVNAVAVEYAEGWMIHGHTYFFNDPATIDYVTHDYGSVKNISKFDVGDYVESELGGYTIIKVLPTNHEVQVKSLIDGEIFTMPTYRLDFMASPPVVEVQKEVPEAVTFTFYEETAEFIMSYLEDPIYHDTQAKRFYDAATGFAGYIQWEDLTKSRREEWKGRLDRFLME